MYIPNPRYDMTTMERLAISKLFHCKLEPSGKHFRFVDALYRIKKGDNPKITRVQRQTLWSYVIRYRRQFDTEAAKAIVGEAEKFLSEEGKQGRLGI